MALESRWRAAHVRVRVLLAVTAVGALAYAAFIAAGKPPALSDAASIWIYHGTLLFASLTCFAGAASVHDQRGAWTAFGLGLLFWTGADLYWTLAYTNVARAPYPSLADSGYLAALPCFYVGIVLLIRRRVGHFTAASWLDGAIGGLAAASLATALLAPALVGLTQGDAPAVLTNLAYPLGGILLISFILGALVVSGFRGAGAFLAIAAGLITWTVADGIYLYQEATSTYSGGWLDELWLIGPLLIASAVPLTFTHRPRRRVYNPQLLFPAFFAAIAVGVLVWDHFSPQHEISVWLSAATLMAVIIRMGISFRENSALLSALDDDASTDALTELGNQRHLRAPGGRQPPAPAGATLASALGPDGCAYRLGGDEFCILVPSRGGLAEPIADAGRAALTEQGEGFRISASAGAVLLSAEATVASEALRLADRRMYSEKSARSGRERQSHELLLTLMREREPELADHHEDVSRLAVAMGRELAFDAEEIDVLRRAADYHDIGKIAIPEEILRKPEPLNEIEWELMRKHTLVGERLLGTFPSMAPVARIVRASHERWDGEGYPDGLAGEEIPLGARVIIVCDAYDAMRGERAYSTRRDQQDALAELRRGAGTQFDPHMVEVFSHVIDQVKPCLGKADSSTAQPPGSELDAQLAPAAEPLRTDNA